MKRCEARSNPRAPPSAVLEEQRLDNDIHDCAGFDCGVPALNDYLRKFASQHRRRGVSQTYVLVDDSTPIVDPRPTKQREPAPKESELAARSIAELETTKVRPATNVRKPAAS